MDTVGVVHAVILRAQALPLPIKTLVLAGIDGSDVSPHPIDCTLAAHLGEIDGSFRLSALGQKAAQELAGKKRAGQGLGDGRRGCEARKGA